MKTLTISYYTCTSTYCLFILETQNSAYDDTNEHSQQKKEMLQNNYSFYLVIQDPPPPQPEQKIKSTKEFAK